MATTARSTVAAQGRADVEAVVAAEAAVAVDRFGLSFRSELAPGIFGTLDRIDLIEVIADDWLDIEGRQLSALTTLAAQVPVTLHGIGLGAASCHPVDERHLERLGRLINAIRPDTWSEHLAFVRAGGVEIGHLAAPPRDPATVDGTARNLERVRRVIGTLPQLENVATLFDPPGSTLDEAAWLNAVLAVSDSSLLLDLHNLHANAVNFGFSAEAVIHALPRDRIASIHLAGGWQMPGRRLVDDHLHAVPDRVFALLECVGAHASRPLDVILERDGCFPAFDALLAELSHARAALARGRARGTALAVAA